MNELLYRAFDWIRCRARLLWVLMTVFGFTASAAPVDTSTNSVSISELLKRYESIPLPEVRHAAESGDAHASHYLGYCYAEGIRVTRDANEALKWYQRGMQAGYLRSASNIGVLYQKGRLGPNESAKAVYYYTYAAERGLALAQANLGMLYRDGNGVPQDRKQAMHWFQLAAAQGDATAMVEIGRLYRFGEGVETNIDEAIRWFEKAAKEKDSALIQMNLGLIYQDQDQFQKALPFYEAAANQGSAEAMIQLYLSYWEGKQVPPDHAKAMEWLTKAAGSGDPYAECLLGYRYETPVWEGKEGRDRRLTTPKWGQAFHWYHLSAEPNWPGGQYHLGMLYVHGKGVEQDEARGLELIRAAADQGLEAAMHDLAGLYAQGIGSPRNAADRPVELLRRSKSWEELAYRYEHGIGTERDMVAAAECYCEMSQLKADYYWRYMLADKVEVHPGKSQVAMRNLPTEDGHLSVELSIPFEDGSDDLRHALSLYLKSAMGDGQSAFTIGDRYLKGQDVPQSAARAWIWFSLAAQNGSAEAPAKVKELESNFNPEQLKTVHEEYASEIQKLRRFADSISWRRQN